MNFEGFGSGACAWFGELKADNTKEWFTANRARFDEEIKAPMQALLADMENRFGGSAKLFRQHRDVRFSKDKSPYKTATYGGVYDPSHALGWYAAIDATGFFAGRGVYQMAPDMLSRYREAVSGEAGAVLASAVEQAVGAGLTLSGEGGKGAPRGFPKDHPRVDLLRRKALVLGARIPAEEVNGAAPWDHA
ncbi:MAG: DUF2461 domain-containing protein [Pseudomonadota bacterium]